MTGPIAGPDHQAGNGIPAGQVLNQAPWSSPGPAQSTVSRALDWTKGEGVYEVHPLGPGQGTQASPPCQRGQNGHRVIPQHHTDTCPGDTCEGCQLCPHHHCTTCQRTHTPTGSCPSCLAMARTNLDTIVLLVGHLPGEALHGRHSLHTHEGIPGGDALVMLTPARPRTGARVAPPVRPELPNDPRPPHDVLAYWAETWATGTQSAITYPPTLGNTASYLDGQLHLIAAHPLFPKLTRDLARLRHQVENVLHAGQRPELSRVPCWDCGARLVKVYADTPQRDHWRCPVCGETYDRGRYDRAKHDHLHSQGADRFVPVSDAIAATGRPEPTVRTWIRNQWVESQRDPTTGRLLVWWPDVRHRHLTTQTRRRSA